MSHKVKLTEPRFKMKQIASLIVGAATACLIIVQILHDGLANLLTLVPIN
jgi:hypothetical protein